MLSRIDLINWKLNQNINPKTNRKIKETGQIYKKLSVEYYKNFKLDLSKIIDHIDLVTQDRFIITNKSGNRQWVYKDLDNIVFYQEENKIRAFTKFSLSFLKKNNINEHPVSKKEIPNIIFKDILIDETDTDKLDESDESDISNQSKIFFQKLSFHSIFINYEHFLALDLEKLNKLAYELKEFYYQNLSLDIRIQIDKKDGKLLFNNKPDLEENLKKYLIKNMNSILDNIDDEMKVFSYYIIVGALSLVISEVKDNYPNYSFSF